MVEVTKENHENPAAHREPRFLWTVPLIPGRTLDALLQWYNKDV
jgi:hypothetical protein